MREALEAEATSVDDTRDIAIRAETGVATAQAAASAATAQAAAASAQVASLSGKTAENERRLNTINGQIGRLGDSHEGMRDDFNRALYGVGDDDGGLVGTVIELKATVTHAIKVAGTIVGIVVTISTGITVYEVEHTGAPQTPPVPKASVRTHHQVSSRQRGLSGQLLAVQQYP